MLSAHAAAPRPAHERRRVRAGIDGLDAVVSTVGGGVKDARADGEGNINLIEAAAAAGVRKFVLVTSIGTGDSKDAPGPEVYKVLEPVLIEKDKAEQALMVRPRCRHTRRGQRRVQRPLARCASAARGCLCVRRSAAARR